MIAEMILELCGWLIDLNSEGIEQFAIRVRGINISYNDDVSSLIEVGNDVSGFDSAVNLCMKKELPLSEVQSTTMWLYLNLS